MSLYLPGPSTGVKCQQVNGYATVQTALGHYQPRGIKNVKENKTNAKNEKKDDQRYPNARSQALLLLLQPYNFLSVHEIGLLYIFGQRYNFCMRIYKVYMGTSMYTRITKKMHRHTLIKVCPYMFCFVSYHTYITNTHFLLIPWFLKNSTTFSRVGFPPLGTSQLSAMAEKRIEDDVS